MPKKTIESAVFVKGVIDDAGIPRDLNPHVAFIGRSNVGKSSVINSLVNVKGLCKSSSTPGRTTEANLFLINKKIYFTDLPGYGYARQPNARRKEIEAIIYWYLTDVYVPLRTVVLLIDAKVGVTKDDLTTYDLLLPHIERYKIIVIANKFDKVKQSNAREQLTKIRFAMPEFQVFPYSTFTGEGKEEILKEIMG